MPDLSSASSFSAKTIQKTPLNNLSNFAVGVLSLALLASAAGAQQTPQTPPSHPELPGLSPNPAQSDTAVERMSEKMAHARNSERQQEIVADSARLLKLAQQLNTDVARSNKYTLSLSVVKEAGEIEKLAKTIKDKMKEGY